MKKVVLSVFTLLPVLLTAVPVLAADLMVPAAMQRCNTNEDCAMISNTCSDSCGSAPVNRASLPALEQQYTTRCGKSLESQPKCTMNPPLSSACINNRCTVDYAFANHAGPADYKSGAYPVPEAPVQSQANPAAAPANDRQGFTAYDMQGQPVKQNTLGEIKNTVYVPPQAPVSGGNYVPVTPQSGVPAAQQPAPIPPAPAPAPAAAVPPPAPVPTQAPQAQMDQPPYATPRAPAAPTTYIPAKPEFAPPTEPQIIPPPAPAPAPQATATPPALPPMPPQPAPIIASDANAPRLAPPAGETIPAGPNDPGATPPDAALLAPIPAALGEKAENNKSFTAVKQKTHESFN